MVDSLLGKLLLWLPLPMLLLCSSMVPAKRIRDLTSIEGVRENALIGYGLVVGLDGRVIKLHKRHLLPRV